MTPGLLHRGRDAPLGWGAGGTILKTSVQDWNALRQRNPDWVPHLAGIDLEGAELARANLRDADLRGTYLCGACLRWADCRGADLRRALLMEADLTAADLRRANLTAANLAGAQLFGAKLQHAVIAQTILDPERWAKPLVKLWEQAPLERRWRMLEALRTKTALRRKWSDGVYACPEALLSDAGADTDDFMAAWNTYGITEEQVLQSLQPALMVRAAAAN